MDQHEDDIRILSADDEDLTTDHDVSGIPQFFVGTSKADITPASVHAFQTAYGDLKKRYNDLESKNRTLRRQIRETNILKMTSENGFPNHNQNAEDYPHLMYGPGGDTGAHAQGAAAMADPTALDHVAKQGYINHLTQQLNLSQSQRQALEEELKMMRQKLEDLRQKHNKVVQENTRLHSDLTSMIGAQDRHPQEVQELKTEIRKLHQLLQVKQQQQQKAASLEATPLSQPKRLMSTSRPALLVLDEEDGGVVSLSEFRRVKDQMEQCQANMVTLRKVVEQQNSLIKNLQSDRSSKGSSTSSNLSRASDGYVNEVNLLDTAISCSSTSSAPRQLQRPLSPRAPRPLGEPPNVQPVVTNLEQPMMVPISSTGRLGDDLCTDRVPDSPGYAPYSPGSLPVSPISPPPHTDGADFDTIIRTGRYHFGKTLGQGDIRMTNSVPTINNSRSQQKPTAVENMDRYNYLGSSTVHQHQTQNTANNVNVFESGHAWSSSNGNAYGCHRQMPGMGTTSLLSPNSASYSEVLRRPKDLVGMNHDYLRNDSTDNNRTTDRTNLGGRTTESVTVPVQNSSHLPPRPSTQIVASSSPQPSAEAPTMQVCPICTKDFTLLTMGDFQNHVFDCYDNTDSTEIVPQSISESGVIQPPSQPTDARVSRRNNGIPRTCPVCETEFHLDIPQEVYEKHVYEHFGEQNIVDDFAVLGLHS